MFLFILSISWSNTFYVIVIIIMEYTDFSYHHLLIFVRSMGVLRPSYILFSCGGRLSSTILPKMPAVFHFTEECGSFRALSLLAYLEHTCHRSYSWYFRPSETTLKNLYGIFLSSMSETYHIFFRSCINDQCHHEHETAAILLLVRQGYSLLTRHHWVHSISNIEEWLMDYDTVWYL